MPPQCVPSFHSCLHRAAHAAIAGFCAIFAVQPSLAQASNAGPSPRSATEKVMNLPLHFEPAPDGSYASRIGHHAVEIGDGGQVHFFANDHDSIGISLAGSASSKPSGDAPLPGHTNYLLGNDAAQWRQLVPQYARTRVNAVYPGIDLVYYGNGRELEHDYLVAPNADAHAIAFKIDHAAAQLDAGSGELLVQADGSEAIRLRKPIAYQTRADGSRQVIASAYEQRPNGQYGFALGDYDHTRALVIDPVVLYGSYFGGKYNDSIIDIKVASDGSLYLLLTTDSTDLKTVGATTGACPGKCGATNPDAGSSAQPDMYLAKLDSNAQTLLFATYLGGSDSDQAYNLALDTDGSVYISGTTHSMDFPIVNGYPGGAPVSGGSPAGTLTKLSADGSTILYSTFIGYGLPLAESPTMVGNAAAHAMVTANNGVVYLIGQAGITDAAFIWEKSPLFTVGADFLAKLDTTKTGTASVVYATRVGDVDNSTSNAVQVTSVAVNSKGDVWLYGETKNSAFPATSPSAFQPQCTTPASSSCLSSFLMEIDPTGASVLYATYLGGSGGYNVTSFDIQTDASDTIYVSGYTDQTNFPILNGAYPTLPGSAANFISKISSDGKSILYSTYVQSDIFSVTPDGKLAFTIASGAGFPLKNNLQTPAPAGGIMDAAFGLIDTTLSGTSSLLMSSYLGTNTGSTQPQRVYLASTGQILIMGETTATDLPATNAYQATRGGGTYDGFLAIVQPSNSLTLTPTALTFPDTAVGSTSTAMSAQLFNGTTQPVYVSQGIFTDPDDFTLTINDCGIVQPGKSCALPIAFNPKTSGAKSSTYSVHDLNTPSNPLTLALSGNGTGTGAKANTVTPNFLNFGNVAYRTRATLPVTFTNNGTATVTLQPYTVSDSSIFAADFNGTCSNNPVVPAGGSCTYNVIFIPEANQSYSGTFTVVDGITNPVVTLAGVGLSPTGGTGALIINPSPVNAANVPAHQDGYGNYTITNTTTQTITLLSTNTTSTTNDMDPGLGGCFAATNVQRTPTLVPGASCSDYIDYHPATADEKMQGTLNYTYQVQGSSVTYSVSFTVTGNSLSDAVLGVSPTTLQFPATPAGKTSTQTLTVSNSGESPLTFNSATVTSGNTKNFSQTNTCGTSVAGKSSCTVTVTFAPDTSMTEFTATLDIQTSAPRPDSNQTDTTNTIVQLNGGTNPADFVVSSNSGPASYNPYTATWTINVAPLEPTVPWTQPVTFAMTSELGSYYGTPVFTPASVTPGNTTVSTTMTLTQPGSPVAREIELTKKLPVLACGVLCLFCFRRRFKSSIRLLVVFAAMSLAALSLSGCENPPINIVVTATSGSVSHTVTVVFQP